MQTSKKRHTWLWVVLFLVCVVLINGVLNFLLYPYTYARIDMQNLATKKYEDLFVGTSHGKCGIDPVLVEKETGRAGLNLCMGGQFMVDSYFTVKEACRVNPPKRVVLELDAGYWMLDIPQDTSFGQTYLEMPWSLVKGEYLLAKFMEKDFRNALFPWYAYRGRLNEMAETVKTKWSEDYRTYNAEYFHDAVQAYEESGFIRRYYIEGAEKPETNLLSWDEKQIREDNFKYFEKLVDLCREEGVELVVITTPVPMETLGKDPGSYEAAHEYFAEYFGEQGVPYMDFNVEHPGYTLADYADYEGHMYEETAGRFSGLLGERLKEGGE